MPRDTAELMTSALPPVPLPGPSYSAVSDRVITLTPWA